MHYEQICDRYGSDTCPVTIADYEEICAQENWPHGKFTEDDLGIYEDGQMIAERVFDVGDRVRVIKELYDYEYAPAVGSTGTVTKASLQSVEVRLDDQTDDIDYSTDGSDLELIK